MIAGLFLGALAFAVTALVAALAVPAGGAAVAVLGLLAMASGVLRARSPRERTVLGPVALLAVAGVLVGLATGGGIARAAAATAQAKAQADEAATQQLLARVPEASSKLDGVEQLIQLKDLDGAAARLRDAQPLLRALGPHRNRAPEVSSLELHATKVEAALSAAREAQLVAHANELLGRQGVPLRPLLDAIADFERLSGASPQALQVKAGLVTHVNERVATLGVLRHDHDVFEAKQLGHSARVPKGATEMALSQFLPNARATASFEKGVCSGLYIVAVDRSVGLDPALANAFVDLAVGPSPSARQWPRPPKPTQTVTRTQSGVPVVEGWLDGKLVELSIGQVAL